MMKRLFMLLSLALMVGAAMALSGVALAATTPSGTLDANTTTSPVPVEEGVNFGFNKCCPQGQVFTAKNSGKIHDVQFQMVQGYSNPPSYPAPDAGVTVQLAETDSSGKPTTVLVGGSTTVAVADIPSEFSSDLVTAHFDNSPQVDKGKKYALVLSTGKTVGTYQFSLKGGNADPDGERFITATSYPYDGWELDPAYDFVYAIYVDTGVSLTLPAPIVKEATSSAGAKVLFDATATADATGSSVPVICAPASGATFELGTTTVTCSATDAAGNEATGSFDVKVQDTTKPVISGIPPSVLSVPATSTDGATVTFPSITASDLVDGASVLVTCDPASGSTFQLGTTTVNCSATDAAGNVASGSFHVTVQDKVQDTTAPKVSTATPTGTGIARNTNLTATFSEKMAPLSITNSTFKLFKVKPDGSTTQITNVSVSLSTDGLTAKLNPFGTSSTVLSAKTKYKGVITTGAKDVAGNQLDESPTTAGLQQKTWTFTTKG
jgi:hypothetical protein